MKEPSERDYVHLIVERAHERLPQVMGERLGYESPEKFVSDAQLIVWRQMHCCRPRVPLHPQLDHNMTGNKVRLWKVHKEPQMTICMKNNFPCSFTVKKGGGMNQPIIEVYESLDPLAETTSCTIPRLAWTTPEGQYSA